MNEAAASDALARIAEALERAFPPTAEHADSRLPTPSSGRPVAPGCVPCRWWPEFPTTFCAGSSAWPTRSTTTRADLRRGLPANNALLWGARGMGKSSLVKAIHARVNQERSHSALVLIEIHREDIESLPRLLHLLADERPALPAVLRRPVVRCRGDQLQVAQGRARGRDRGPARATSCSTRPRTAVT